VREKERKDKKARFPFVLLHLGKAVKKRFTQLCRG